MSFSNIKNLYPQILLLYVIIFKTIKGYGPNQYSHKNAFFLQSLVQVGSSSLVQLELSLALESLTQPLTSRFEPFLDSIDS